MNQNTAAEDAVETSLSPLSIVALVCGSVVTVIWLVVSIYFLKDKVASCNEGVFVCTSVSDWGDFLAGTFSPLAFVWLVVAVILQSMELREQRRELALTRAEYEEGRAVAQAQADESKRQAEFIGAQTKILDQQYQDQKREREIGDFEQCLNALHNLLNQRLNRENFLTALNASGEVQSVGFRIDPMAPRDEVILYFERQILLTPLNVGLREPIRFGEGYLPVAREALSLCDTAIELSKKLGGFPKFTASRLRLVDLRDKLARLMPE